MSHNQLIGITAVGWEIPGWNNQNILDALDSKIAYGELDPAATLGKKGLRYKDEATKLALCAVNKALESCGLLELEKEQRANIGIIVSSNLGNMDTVCQESGIIHDQHVDSTSPMNLPVASSNVIPSSIAIRYGFKGVNLMLCNGSTSGVDAINIARQMLKAGRAEKMVVVGVEPDNAITRQLLSECDADNVTGKSIETGLLAACLILEPVNADDDNVLGLVGDYQFAPSTEKLAQTFSKPDVWFTPSQSSSRSEKAVAQLKADAFADIECIDVSANSGELYGALGVYQALVALTYLRQNDQQQALISNGLTFGDGVSSLQLSLNG
ncbi:beta-ketoacyl synthase N-terminal-like domain-containing protein [Aliikangiella maris]|uniref:Beta-ketoacyl synthase N-terminal-like domain-containing protein n=2 Tax=Aliikangiella maris TaxID=3162458 RepID=A0ABV3MPS2_9GAMM